VSPSRSEPAVQSHFERFGLPERFELDQAALDERFRRYQAAVHPDRHAGGSDAERRLALRLAADGNEAHRTLADPTRRAAYLCELHGAPIDAERNTAMPPGFLIRQMEWREAIDAVRDQPAAATELAVRLAAERDRALTRLLGLLDVEHDYASAAQAVRQLMFFDKLQAELRLVFRRPASILR